MGKKKTYLYILGVLALIIIVAVVGWQDVKDIVIKITLREILFLLLLQLITLFMTGYIWFFFMRKLDKEVSLLTVLGVHLAGSFVESITPSVKFGGEAAKVYLMRQRSTLTYQELTAVTLVSKYFSLIPFVSISFFVIVYTLFAWDFPIIISLSFLSLVLLLLLFILFFRLDSLSSKVCSKSEEEGFEECDPNVSTIKERIKTKLVIWISKTVGFAKESSEISHKLTKTSARWRPLGIAFIVWALYPVKVYLVASMLGFQLSPFIIVIATYTAYTVSMLPLLPGGLGSFEGSMVLVLTYAGLATAEGLSIALVARLVTFWFPFFLSAGAVLLLFYKKGKIHI